MESRALEQEVCPLAHISRMHVRSTHAFDDMQQPLTHLFFNATTHARRSSSVRACAQACQCTYKDAANALRCSGTRAHARGNKHTRTDCVNCQNAHACAHVRKYAKARRKTERDSGLVNVYTLVQTRTITSMHAHRVIVYTQTFTSLEKHRFKIQGNTRREFDIWRFAYLKFRGMPI